MLWALRAVSPTPVILTDTCIPGTQRPHGLGVLFTCLLNVCTSMIHPYAKLSPSKLTHQLLAAFQIVLSRSLGERLCPLPQLPNMKPLTYPCFFIPSVTNSLSFLPTELSILKANNTGWVFILHPKTARHFTDRLPSCIRCLSSRSCQAAALNA